MSFDTSDSLAALRFPVFRSFMLCRIFLTLAVQIQSVLVGWQIFELTNDPLALGLIGLAEVIPNVTVGLFGGHFADVFDRKRITLICLITLLIVTFTMGYYANVLVPYQLYLLIFMTGFARGFMEPAIFGILTQAVPKQIYLNSSSWASSLWQIASVIGAGASGFIFNALGFSQSYFLATIFLVFAFVSILVINRNSYAHDMVPSQLKIFSSIKEGLIYVRNQPIILGSMVLDMFAVLFGGAVALLPIFAKDILGVGAEGLGLLRSAPSVGAILMAFYITRFPPTHNTGKKLFAAIFIFGLCMLGFSLSTNLYLSLFFLFISGAADNISVIIRRTITQTFSPESMKGRISSVSRVFISSSNELGAFESGVTAKFMGAVGSVLFGGSMTIIVVLSGIKVFPELYQMEFKDIKPVD
ncbi:MFS transporter [Bacteriovoracaceae bacterium]|nr:MFS transporter [Bacteriovoracaceae bacterium]